MSENDIYSGKPEKLNLKTFYNTLFLVKARHFINNYDWEVSLAATPIRSQRKNLFQKLNIDSPLKVNTSNFNQNLEVKEMKLNNVFSMTDSPPKTPIYQKFCATESPFGVKRPPEKRYELVKPDSTQAQSSILTASFTQTQCNPIRSLHC